MIHSLVGEGGGPSSVRVPRILALRLTLPLCREDCCLFGQGARGLTGRLFVQVGVRRDFPRSQQRHGY